MNIAVLIAIVSIAACANAGQPPVTQTSDGRAPSMSLISNAAANLMYVSSAQGHKLSAFSYLKGGVGQLNLTIQTPQPGGICTDKAGDIYSPVYSDREILVFTHGSKKPSRTLRISSGYPTACAVDQTNGNLAVTISTPHGKFYEGSFVRIFTKGSFPFQNHTPQAGFVNASFLAYDNKHNLFAIASPCPRGCGYGSIGGPPGLWELTAGSQWFVPIALSKYQLGEAAGLAWVNPTLLVADNAYRSNATPTGVKLLVRNGGATVVQTIPFGQTQQAEGIAFRAGVAIVADAAGNAVETYSIADGSLIGTTSVAQPYGVAVSASP